MTLPQSASSGRRDPAFAVPGRYRSDLRAIAHLTDADFTLLHSTLGAATPDLDPDRLVTAVAMALTEVPEARGIAEAIISLYLARSLYDWDADWLVDQVAGSLADTGRDDAVGDIPDGFTNRLTALLQFDDTVGITAKALDVAIDHAHSLCRARILSDIRPIFSTAVTDDPSAAVIVHTLKIKYHAAGNETANFFVALTPEELRDLRRLIDRAEQKEVSMTRMLSQAGVTTLSDLAESGSER